MGSRALRTVASTLLWLALAAPAAATGSAVHVNYFAASKVLEITVPADAVPEIRELDNPPRFVVSLPGTAPAVIKHLGYQGPGVTGLSVLRTGNGTVAELRLLAPLHGAWTTEVAAGRLIFHLTPSLVAPPKPVTPSARPSPSQAPSEAPMPALYTVPSEPAATPKPVATPAPHARRPRHPAPAVPLPPPAQDALGDGIPNHVLWVAKGSGLVLAFLVLVLMVTIIVLRLMLVFEQHRRQRFLRRWKPLLMESMLNPTGFEFPEVRPHDWLTFLTQWNHLHGFLRGEARDKLAGLGNEIGMGVVARRYLQSGSTRKRLMAILTLGNLRAKYSWHTLKRILEEDNAYASLAAMKALADIDVNAALPLLIPQIASRTDWSPVRVASILHEAGFDKVALPIAEAARQSPPDQAARLLRYLSASPYTGAGGVLRQIIEETDSDRVVSICLQAMKEPQDLPFVRLHLGHAQWFVRVQAATALGRLGMSGDEALLLPMLSDREWWVRYRAAQALVSMPFVTSQALNQIRREHPDRYARDITHQVMAEAQRV